MSRRNLMLMLAVDSIDHLLHARDVRYNLMDCRSANNQHYLVLEYYYWAQGGAVRRCTSCWPKYYNYCTKSCGGSPGPCSQQPFFFGRSTPPVLSFSLSLPSFLRFPSPTMSYLVALLPDFFMFLCCYYYCWF